LFETVIGHCVQYTASSLCNQYFAANQTSTPHHRKVNTPGTYYHSLAMQLIPDGAEYLVTVQRSRFHALSVAATDLEGMKKAVALRQREMRKARHHSWAYRGRDNNGLLVEQARDDGEVGRPGMVLLKLLRRHDLEGGLLVSRFFGGVKLGPGGVSRAFKLAGEGLLSDLGYDAT